MKIGKEVSYIDTKVGEISITLEGYIIIKSDDGVTNIYNREEYETFLKRNEKISKLLEIN